MFREAHPLVSVVLEESGTNELADRLRSEAIDVAIVRSRISDPSGIATHKLLDEEMVAAIPRGHKLVNSRKDGPIRLSSLAEEPFILYRRPLGPGLYDAIIGACRSAGFSPTVGQEAPRITSTLNLVAAGLGVTLVPRSLERLRMDGVVYRPIAGAPGLVAPLSLAFRRNEAAPAARRFVELARRLAREPHS
jgi:DNA-binding transcriptional LysR family regulator